MDINITKLCDQIIYKNYIIYNDKYVHIFDIKLNQVHKICNIKESMVICYNYKLLYFNYRDYIKNINIKILNLPISSLFEKCVYWIDETKLPDIAKKRVIDHRRDYLI